MKNFRWNIRACILGVVFVILLLSLGVSKLMTGEHSVHIYIGEPLDQYCKENSDQASLTDYRHDNDPFIWPKNDLSGERFVFTLGKPGEEVIFHKVRLIWITQSAGIIYGVQVSASEQKRSLQAAYMELRELRASFLKAGWTERSPIPTQAQVTESIEQAQGTSTSLGAAEYIKDGTSALLTITVAGDVMQASAIAKTSFITEVLINNDKLQQIQEDKMFAAREKVKGTPNQSLPLSYWVK